MSPKRDRSTKRVTRALRLRTGVMRSSFSATDSFLDTYCTGAATEQSLFGRISTTSFPKNTWFDIRYRYPPPPQVLQQMERRKTGALLREVNATWGISGVLEEEGVALHSFIFLNGERVGLDEPVNSFLFRFWPRSVTKKKGNISRVPARLFFEDRPEACRSSTMTAPQDIHTTT